MSHQATFMGLPPELRLRIYDYALDPFGNKPLSTQERHERKCNCCLYSSRPNKTRCDCADGEISLAILRVNKQVYTEAMPILCAHAELRVRMPFTEDSDPLAQDSGTELQTTLFAMSKHAKKHMRRLLLVGGKPWDPWDETLWPCNGFIGSLARYCMILASELPNVRHVRIHLDVNEPELNCLKDKLYAFKGLTGLTKFCKLSFELDRRELHINLDSWSGDSRKEMQALFAGEIMKTFNGKIAEIDVQVIDEDWEG